jgi:hypothetical protein
VPAGAGNLRLIHGIRRVGGTLWVAALAIDLSTFAQARIDINLVLTLGQRTIDGKKITPGAPQITAHEAARKRGSLSLPLAQEHGVQTDRARP